MNVRKSAGGHIGFACLLSALSFASANGAIFTSTPARQREWQADIRVEALEAVESRATGAVTIRFRVSTEGSDAAKDVRVEVLLPLGVGVARVSDSCHPTVSPIPGLSARVTCDIGDMTSGHDRDLSVMTSARNNAPLHYAAFAFSDTPDPIPANNFAERTLQ